MAGPGQTSKPLRELHGSPEIQPDGNATKSNSQRLLYLSRVALMVDLDGRITDHDRLPSVDGPPLKRPRGRVAFTAEDDRLLADWVARAEAEGLKISGISKIFEDLARINLRHTSQSWQKHWTKAVRDLPRSCVAPDAGDAVTRFSSILSSAAVTRAPSSPNSTSASALSSHQSSVTASPGASVDPTLRLAETSLFPPLPSPADAALLDAPAAPRQTCHAGDLPPTPHTGRAARYMLTQPKAESEKTLQKLLKVHKRDGLATWLTQDWVLDAYSELAAAEFLVDQRGEALAVSGPVVTRALRGSGKNFIVDQAKRAVQSNNPRYTDLHVNKAGWTRDDHDIRFVAQIVHSGRMKGRWWEHRGQLEDVPELCDTAYRLMSWLRSQYTLTVTADAAPTWLRPTAFQWITLLNDATARRINQTRPATYSPPVVSPSPAAARLLSPDAQLAVPQSLGDHCATVVRPSARVDPSANLLPPSHAPIAVVRDERAEEQPQKCSADRDYESHSSARCDLDLADPPKNDSLNQKRHRQAHWGKPPPEASKWAKMPKMPVYPVKQSRRTHSQVEALDWMLASGKLQFTMRQNNLLAQWGVTARHNSTCILVPSMWSALDPLSLVNDLDLSSCPPEYSPRLSYTMLDHTTSWFRAAMWFADDSWPRSGLAFDNFLGTGPFIPMEGSHRCHHPECVNATHGCYEDTLTNLSRNRCLRTAQDIRELGQEVPEHCAKHEPPCLMQLAALTTREAYLIQFSVLRRAKGLPSVNSPSKPADHPFQTFEYQLPLLFPHRLSTVLSEDLVSTELPSAIPLSLNPTFHCRFCPYSRVFKSVIGYWSHVFKKHLEISNEKRLEEMIRAGMIWRDHLEDSRARGSGISYDDPTWLKLEQIKEESFNWEVVMTWKLG